MLCEYWSSYAFRHVDAFLFRSQLLCLHVTLSSTFVISVCHLPSGGPRQISWLLQSHPAVKLPPPRHLHGVQATVVAAISQHTQPCYPLHFWHFLFCLHTVWKDQIWGAGRWLCLLLLQKTEFCFSHSGRTSHITCTSGSRGPKSLFWLLWVPVCTCACVPVHARARAHTHAHFL